MNASVRWQGGLSFMGSADSGFAISLGADPSVGGADDGLRPMELIALGLAGCTAMDVISILRKKRQQVEDFEVHVHARRADEHPKVFTAAEIEYLISGYQVDEQAVRRAIELSSTTYCPAQAMLSRVMPITLKYTIFEVQKDGSRVEAVSGTYP